MDINDVYLCMEDYIQIKKKIVYYNHSPYLKKKKKIYGTLAVK